MSTDEQFRELARKAYRSYHEDGLLDLLIGWIILSIGLGYASSWIGPWPTLGFFLAAASYFPLKKRITVPRLGYVQFAPERSREILIKIVYPVVFCTFMIVLLLTMEIPESQRPVGPVWTPSEAWPFLKLWLQGKSLLLFGITALVVLGLIGAGTGIRRMVGYGLLGLAILLAGQLSGLPTSTPLFVLGGAVFAAGIVILVRFLRTHPVLPEDSAAEERTNHAFH